MAAAGEPGRRGSSGLTVALAIVVILLDQLTKWWIVSVVMQPPRVIEITPFFELVLAHNRGVSFSLLRLDAAWGPWVLSAFAVAVVVWLFLWQRRAGSRLLSAAVGLVMGGALGNVVDRLHAAAVTDFIEVHAAGYYFPAFNLADSAITVGVVLLLLEALFSQREKPKSRAS